MLGLGPPRCLRIRRESLTTVLPDPAEGGKAAPAASGDEQCRARVRRLLVGRIGQVVVRCRRTRRPRWTCSRPRRPKTNMLSSTCGVLAGGSAERVMPVPVPCAAAGGVTSGGLPLPFSLTPPNSRTKSRPRAALTRPGSPARAWPERPLPGDAFRCNALQLVSAPNASEIPRPRMRADSRPLRRKQSTRTLRSCVSC
jgi:hypothetical protein